MSALPRIPDIGLESDRMTANDPLRSLDLSDAISLSEENLTKLHIDLPHHWGTGGESLWAEELGSDLYRIRNVPFFAYGLNFFDVVRATADSPDLKPEIREIVKPSGHKTLRLFFEDSVDRDEQVKLLESLHEYKAYYERANGIHVAIDIEPEGSYQDVCNRLSEWENAGLLSYETCEARIPGSFDDVLEAD